MEKESIELAMSVGKELETLQPFKVECRIQRVPERLHQVNKKDYKPRMVSIGPIHHGQQDLEIMEKYKNLYLLEFLRRGAASLEVIIQFIREQETKVRKCYAETIEPGSDDFIKMILRDAAFVIEVFLRNVYLVPDIGGYLGDTYKILEVKEDLFLIENQLPFFILDGIFQKNETAKSVGRNEIAFTMVAHKFLMRNCWGLLVEEDDLDEIKISKVQNLTDFLRICMLPRNAWMGSAISGKLTMPSATELHRAGVKFRLRSTNTLLDISFDNGILEIPKIEGSGSIEIILKNLMAFEQTQSESEEYHINDYVIVISCLVKTPQDVELLVKKKIMENRIGDSQLVANLFRCLGECSILHSDNFNYSEVFKVLEMYCSTRWRKGIAILRRDYFNTAWANTVSIIAATVLFVLTLVQTICSIVQVFQNYK